MAIVVAAKDSKTIIIEVTGKVDILAIKEFLTQAGLQRPDTTGEKLCIKYIAIADMFNKLLWKK